MVESEHAAMSACTGAAAAGGRVATATSSQGLALMIEVLYQCSGMRLPAVLCLVNRALASPLNVNGDHSDLYLTRDSGWISLDAYNPQQAYDLTLCAFKIGEHLDVRLPVIVNQDGFMTSHTAQNLHPLDDKTASDFIGKYKQVNAMLDLHHPVSHGVQAEENWHFEHKAAQHHALMNSEKVIKEVFAEFEKLTGRKYSMVETFNMEDAEVAIVCLGSTFESSCLTCEELKKEGIKAGVVGIRVFRPAQLEELALALKDVKAIACLDRSSPNGAAGALYNEVSGALINTNSRPLVKNLVYGLGGRDMTIGQLCDIYRDLNADVKAKKLQSKHIQEFVGVKGPELKFFKA